MRMTDIILKKRDGYALTKEEISYWIEGVSNSEIPDYQSAALLMAICWRGMDDRETADLTMAMTNSGDIIDLSEIDGIKVDKHSTGGIGDTTTLIVAPLVASCSVPVAKMSGRGLSFTGGTLDKLESIDGVNVSLSVEKMIELVKKNAIAVIGQTANLVPADKALYALRDVTSTVDSIPLIASSIMSKKIAAGSDAIVLDVKTGSGAFMKDSDDAFELAEKMVAIGRELGRETVAIVTDMDQPLGKKIGNQLEVQEAIEALSGALPADDPLMKVSMLLGQQMLILSGTVKDTNEADMRLKEALESGAGKEKLRTLLCALGSDGDCVDHPEKLGKTRLVAEIKSPYEGFVSSMDAMQIGTAAQILGAGRLVKSDVIDPCVGIVMQVRAGDEVSEGQCLCSVHANDEAKLSEALKRLESAIHIEKEKSNTRPMLYGIVSNDGILKY